MSTVSGSSIAPSDSASNIGLAIVANSKVATTAEGDGTSGTDVSRTYNPNGLRFTYNDLMETPEFAGLSLLSQLDVIYGDSVYHANDWGVEKDIQARIHANRNALFGVGYPNATSTRRNDLPGIPILSGPFMHVVAPVRRVSCVPGVSFGPVMQAGTDLVTLDQRYSGFYNPGGDSAAGVLQKQLRSWLPIGNHVNISNLEPFITVSTEQYDTTGAWLKPALVLFDLVELAYLEETHGGNEFRAPLNWVQGEGVDVGQRPEIYIYRWSYSTNSGPVIQQWLARLRSVKDGRGLVLVDGASGLSELLILRDLVVCHPYRQGRYLNRFMHDQGSRRGTNTWAGDVRVPATYRADDVGRPIIVVFSDTMFDILPGLEEGADCSDMDVVVDYFARRPDFATYKSSLLRVADKMDYCAQCVGGIYMAISLASGRLLHLPETPVVAAPSSSRASRSASTSRSAPGVSRGVGTDSVLGDVMDNAVRQSMAAVELMRRRMLDELQVYRNEPPVMIVDRELDAEQRPIAINEANQDYPVVAGHGAYLTVGNVRFPKPRFRPPFACLFSAGAPGMGVVAPKPIEWQMLHDLLPQRALMYTTYTVTMFSFAWQEILQMLQCDIRLIGEAAGHIAVPGHPLFSDIVSSAMRDLVLESAVPEDYSSFFQAVFRYFNVAYGTSLPEFMLTTPRLFNPNDWDAADRYTYRRLVRSNAVAPMMVDITPDTVLPFVKRLSFCNTLVLQSDRIFVNDFRWATTGARSGVYSTGGQAVAAAAERLANNSRRMLMLAVLFARTAPDAPHAAQLFVRRFSRFVLAENSTFAPAPFPGDVVVAPLRRQVDWQGLEMDYLEYGQIYGYSSLHDFVYAWQFRYGRDTDNPVWIFTQRASAFFDGVEVLGNRLSDLRRDVPGNTFPAGVLGGGPKLPKRKPSVRRVETDLPIAAQAVLARNLIESEIAAGLMRSANLRADQFRSNAITLEQQQIRNAFLAAQIRDSMHANSLPGRMIGAADAGSVMSNYVYTPGEAQMSSAGLPPAHNATAIEILQPHTSTALSASASQVAGQQQTGAVAAAIAANATDLPSCAGVSKDSVVTEIGGPAAKKSRAADGSSLPNLD